MKVHLHLELDNCCEGIKVMDAISAIDWSPNPPTNGVVNDLENTFTFKEAKQC